MSRRSPHSSEIVGKVVTLIVARTPSKYFFMANPTAFLMPGEMSRPTPSPRKSPMIG